jgi:hypothetical protein
VAYPRAMRPPNKPRSRGRQAQIDALHRCEAAHTALLFVDLQHGFLVAGASLQEPRGRAPWAAGFGTNLQVDYLQTNSSRRLNFTTENGGSSQPFTFSASSPRCQPDGRLREHLEPGWPPGHPDTAKALAKSGWRPVGLTARLPTFPGRFETNRCRRGQKLNFTFASLNCIGRMGRRAFLIEPI